MRPRRATPLREFENFVRERERKKMVCRIIVSHISIYCKDFMKCLVKSENNEL